MTREEILKKNGIQSSTGASAETLRTGAAVPASANGGGNSRESILAKYGIQSSQGAAVDTDAWHDSYQEYINLLRSEAKEQGQSLGDFMLNQQKAQREQSEASKVQSQAKAAGMSLKDWYKQAEGERNAAADEYAEMMRQISEADKMNAGYATDPLSEAIFEEWKSSGRGGLNEQAEERAAKLRKAEQALSEAGKYRYSGYDQREGYSETAEKGLSQYERDRKATVEGQVNDIQRTTAEITGKDPTEYLEEKEIARYADPATYLRKSTDYKEPTDEWTEEQKQLYGYLYATDREEADAYAIDLNSAYGAKKESEARKTTQEYATKNVFTGAVSSAKAILNLPLRGMDYMSKVAQEGARGVIMPDGKLDATEYSSAVKSAISSTLNEKYGTINEDIPILGGKGWGDAYQTATSIAESLYTIGIGGEAGSLAMFFGSAASEGINDALARGIAPDKAVTLGTLNGVAEVLGEKFSVEGLLNIKSAAGAKAILKSIFQQAGIEGSEEGFTTLLNTLADEMVNGDKSELNQNVYIYMTQGMSAAEAEKQAIIDWTNGLGWDIVAGAFSGGISAGITTAGGRVMGTQQYTGADKQELIDQAKSLEQNTEAYKLAESMEKKGKASVNQVERLTRAIADADVQTIASAAKEQLNTLGESGEVSQIAFAVAKTTAGQELTKTEKTALSQSKYGQRLINELKPENILSGEYRSGWAEKLNTKIINAPFYSMGKPAGVANANTESTGDKIIVETKEAQVRTGSIKGTLSGIDAEGRAVIKTGDGEQHLDVEEADMPEDARSLVRALIPLGKSADAAFKAYDGSMDVQEYAAAWDAAENLFAANGAYRSALDESILTRGLNPVQREIAYSYGRRTYEGKKAAQEKGREKSDGLTGSDGPSAPTNAQDDSVSYPATRSKGSVSYEGGTVDGVSYKAVDRKKLTARQKTQAAVAEAMAEATGLDFVLFEGDARGKQGIYVPGGTIYLNINAGAAISKNLMVQTMAHEMTHFIQENAESEYQELKDFVVERMLRAGDGKFETLVLNKMKEWSGLSYGEALDEVVADGCEMMLKSSKAVQQLAGENRSLAGRICQWIKDFVSRLKKAFKGVEARHEEARILMRYAEDMQKLWDRALVQAVHNRDTQGSKNAATEGGSVKYSISEFENGQRFVNVDVDQEIFVGLSPEKALEAARNIIRERFVGRVIGNINRVFVNGQTANEYGHSANRRTTDEQKLEKSRVSTELDNLLDVGFNMRTSPDGRDGHIHKGLTGDFIYLDAIFKIGDRYYQATINIEKNKRGYRLKDVTKIENITERIVALAGNTPRTTSPNDVSMNSIRQEQEKSNTKYSQWDEGVSDRELLLDAATEENASETVLAYARKYRAYEGLLRREERLKARLDAARAAEQSRTGSDPLTRGAMTGESAESIEEKLKKCREEIDRAEERLDRLEAGAELRREADRAREKWFNRNMAEAVKTNRQIREENAELKRYVESYRRQMQRTKPGEERARAEDINRLAKALLKEHGSGLDSSYLADRLQKLGDYIVSNNAGDGISYQELRRAARRIAKDIAENSTVEIDDSRELRQEIRDYLKDTRLKISDELKGDIPDFEAFRRSNLGTLRLSRDGRSIDSAYQEMGEMFGEGLFPQDILAHSEMIQQILDTLDSLRTRQEPAYSRYEMQEVTNLIGEEIIDSLLSGDVRQAETAADRMEARIAEAKMRAYNDRQRLREEQRKSREQLREEKRHGQQMLREEQMRSRERLREEQKIHREIVREKLNELRDRMEERREARQKRVNIDRLANRLTKLLTENSAKNHIPEEMKGDIANFLLSIDNLSPRAGEETREKHLANMIALQRIVDQQRNYMNNGESEGDFPMLDLPEFIRDDLNLLIYDVQRAVQEDREWNVSKLSLDDLQKLERILTVLSTSVSHAVEDIAMAGDYRINELSQESMYYLKEIGDLKSEGKIRQFFREYLSWDNTVPVFAFKRFGPGGEKIFKGIVRGWSRFAMNAKQVLDFIGKAYTAKYAREAENTVFEFQLYKRLSDEDSGETTPPTPTDGGSTSPYTGEASGEEQQYNSKGDGLPLHSENRETVRMSKAQVMGLYCLMKRQHAQGHILGAGIRISDFSDSKKKTVHQAENYLVSIEDFADMVKVLSEEDIKVADALMEYMNTVGSRWGNEVSMKRFGIRAFTEENYYPIRTDDRSRDSRTPEGDRGGLYRLLNMSFTKNTVRNANNAVVIDSIFDVFANHMADMAKYNALSLPIIDAMKWFNFRETSGKSESGQFTTDNVKISLERVYGKQAEKYFITFMQDLNGSREGGRGEGALKRIVSNYKVAAVGANLRVALQQPTSIMRAALQLNGKYIVKGAGMKDGIEKARKYSGLAVWKDMGYYDVNINRGLREKIKHTETRADWLREKSMILTEQGDKITWGVLWNACELETRDKTGLSGEQLMQATAERFDEVILTTQVMDSTISRSQNMRSTSLAMSDLTSFMSEPTLTYNTILDAYTEFMLEKRRNSGKAWEKTRGKIGRTFAVYILTSAFTSMAAAIADACRDDDEYETWVEKWLEHFWENFKDNSNPLKLVPVIKQAYEVVVEGESHSSIIFEPLERMRKAYDVAKETVGLFSGWIDEPTDVTYFGKMNGWGKVYKMIQAAGMLSGIPTGSAAREVVALWNTTFGSWLNKKFKTYDPGPEGEIKDAFLAGYLTEEEAEALLWDKALAKSREDAAQTVYKWSLDGAGVYDAAVDAAKNGDSAAYAAAFKELQENSYAERDVQSKIRSAVKDWYQGTEDVKKSIDKQGAIKRLVSFGGMSRKDAEALVQQWTAKVATGIDYDRIDEAFINREISASRAENMLQTYGGKTADEATEKVQEWQCERDTGIKYSELQDAYDQGRVSADKAENMLQTYGGKSEDEAADTMIRWDFIDGNEELKGISTEGAKNYTEYCEDTGMSKNTYYEAWKAMNQFETDKDENGDPIKNSKKDKVLAYIAGLPISTEQKDALYRVNGWSERNLKNAPWHQG